MKGGAWADMLLGLDLLRKKPGWAGACFQKPVGLEMMMFLFERFLGSTEKKLWESKLVSSFESDGQ